jgi:hypothetical protein
LPCTRSGKGIVKKRIAVAYGMILVKDSFTGCNDPHDYIKKETGSLGNRFTEYDKLIYL